MARGRKQRRPRRIVRRKQRRSRMSSAPPRQNITSNYTHATLPYVVDNVRNDGVRVIDLTRAIFFDGTNAGFKLVYSEVRFQRVRVYYQSNSSTSDSGSIGLMVSDDSENIAETVQGSFALFATKPGVMVRHKWQNISAMWKPTEPSDREFKLLSDGSVICTIVLKVTPTATTNGKLDGQLIAYADVTFRGRIGLTAFRTTISEISSSIMIEDYDQDVKISDPAM